MKKRVISLLCALLFFGIAVVPALAYGYLGIGTIVNCEEWVSLREYPSTSAYCICCVPRSAKVDVYEFDSNFYECVYNGIRGYILTSYVDCSDGGTLSYYLGIGTVVKCDEFVSLRSYPSTSAGRICTVPKGTTVSVYDCGDRKFYKCTYNGYEGYILKEYLSVR